jgi:hypothetical protein
MKLKTKNWLRLASLTALTAVAVLSSGCSTVVAQPKSDNDRQLELLNATTQKVERQLDRLIRLEKGQTEVATNTATHEGLKTILTIQWSGSGEELAEGVAKQLGYRFAKSGTAPFTPVIVPLESKDRSAAEVLNTIANRMSAVAEIKVSNKQKMIEVAYHKQ